MYEWKRTWLFTTKCMDTSETWERWTRHIEWWWLPHKNPLLSGFVASFLFKQVSIACLHVENTHTKYKWKQTWFLFIKVHRHIGNPRKMKTVYWVVVASSQKSVSFQIVHVVSLQTGLNSAFTCQTTHTPSMNENMHGFLQWVHRHIGNPIKMKTAYLVVVASAQKSIAFQICRVVFLQTGLNSAFTCQTTHTHQVWMKTYMVFIYKSASTHRTPEKDEDGILSGGGFFTKIHFFPDLSRRFCRNRSQ